jgi:hypothetical protein
MEDEQDLMVATEQRLLLGITQNVKKIADNEPEVFPLTRGAVIYTYDFAHLLYLQLILNWFPSLLVTRF